MTIVKRSALGRPLTFAELDGNFDEVSTLVSQANEAVSLATQQATASSSFAVQAEQSALLAQQAAAVDRSLFEIARSNNVQDSQVIFSDDKTSTLDSKVILYDKTSQYSWRLPSDIPPGAVISSVNDSQLTYNPGMVAVTMTDPVLYKVNQAVSPFNNRITTLETLQTNFSTVVLNIADYGVLPVESGGTDANLMKTKLDAFRTTASERSAVVFVPSGTYVLPPNTLMNANNTRWFFSPGAIFKLWDTKVTNQDFLIMSNPVNQHFDGLTIDGNRAVQTDTGFGDDRCAFIAIGPDNVSFKNTRVISSSGKGLGITATAGTGSVNRITIEGFYGGNCKTQALILDGNNIQTTWKGGISISKIFVTDTGHAGLAINDGVYGVNVSDVYCKTNNSIWDAVTIRDCTDIQMVNVRGEGGRNGVGISSLNSVSKRFTLDNVIGVGSAQNGVLLQQIEDVIGSNVGGWNNTAGAGLNVAARTISSVSTPCKNIFISNPIGFDNRTTQVQPYGVIIGGCTNGKFGKPLSYGNVTANLLLSRSANSIVYIDIERTSPSQNFTLTGGSNTSLTFTWAEGGFPDNNYDVSVELDVASTGAPVCLATITSKTSTACTVLITSVAGSTGTGVVSVRGKLRP